VFFSIISLSSGFYSFFDLFVCVWLFLSKLDLREAAYTGNIDILKRLIEEEGVDVNEPHPVNKLTGIEVFD
jgi:hypothetical protein